MSVDVWVLSGPEELAEAVADAFVARVSRPVADGAELPAYEVGLTGGSIAREVHRAVAERSDGVPWGHVRFWFGDERFVPTDSPERNTRQAREDLLDGLVSLGRGALPAGHVMEVPSSDDVVSVDVAAASYADSLRHQGTGAWEVVMLGVGPDGHVASLFPHHPSVRARDAITVAVTDAPKPPPERVSLTFEALTRRARAIWFLVSGEEKAEAVARALAPHGSVEETPARGIAEHADPATRVTWWLDEAAASLLP